MNLPSGNVLVLGVAGLGLTGCCGEMSSLRDSYNTSLMGLVHIAPHNSAIVYWDEDSPADNTSPENCKHIVAINKETGEYFTTLPKPVMSYIIKNDDEGVIKCVDLNQESDTEGQ